METNELTASNPWFSGLTMWQNSLTDWANYTKALGRYTQDFKAQSKHAGVLFRQVESVRARGRTSAENQRLNSALSELCMDMFHVAMCASSKSIADFHTKQYVRFVESLFRGDTVQFLNNQSQALQKLADFDNEMEAIKAKYGFHFGDGNSRKCGETDRFELYRIFPFVDGTTRYDLVNESLKPIIIIPPYVLGPNILCFLRDNGKSYVHSFANMGVPTYIRIVKPINTTQAVARMTPEEDCLDTKFFCEKIATRHKQKVTLNGYCQGGYLAVTHVLSGELKDSVDAVMTCVAPMDGTFSRGLKKFLDNLPREFNDLLYGTVKVNGVEVASGQLMSWVYKIKSLDNQAPVVAFYNDWKMMEASVNNGGKLSPTVPALNVWLRDGRVDIPMAITKVSFQSYNIPITACGTLPVTLFGKKLNLNSFEKMGCRYAIFYAPDDDLVEPEVALASAKWATHVEALSGGHVKKATSPSQKVGGPERFHLSLTQTPPDLPLLSKSILRN